MADRSRDVERLAFLRREAEKIVRELFQPESAEAAPDVRLVADLLTEGDQYVLEVEVAGVRPEDLAVYALSNALVVEGKKEEQRADSGGRPAYERAERGYGQFRRVFDLPGPADLSRSSASLAAGLLTITVPRIADRRGRVRPVRIRVLP
jgi:HSP20 family protein